MGFWHTGYAEFHAPTGLDAYAHIKPAPVRYTCVHCSESFDQLEALRKHRFEQHPVRQPALLLRGKPVGTLPQRLLVPLQPGDVLVEDASACLLNGQPVEPVNLGAQLARMRQEYADIELNNRGASSRFRLDFRVADEADLAGVEAAFLRMARDRVLDIQAVSRFNEDCRVLASAMPYCDGVSHYLYGVMAKEHAPDSGLKHEEYVQRFLRSSEELSDLERPLARSIRALVAFHFNQFDAAAYLAPDGALQRAARAFAGLLHGGSWRIDQSLPPGPATAVEDLLTDQETLQLLADASHSADELKDRADDLVSRLHRPTLGGYDQMKRALLACEALAGRDHPAAHAEARRLARTLAGRPETGSWVSAILQRLSAP